MTQLDRSVAPAIRQLEHFSILQPELHRMKNGMPLYVLSAGNEDVIRFDLLVRSGQLDQSQPLQAVFTNRMLREGTVRMTSGEIAERLDYYGAWLDLSSSVNCGFVTLYTLTKHLDRTMEIVPTCPRSTRRLPREDWPLSRWNNPHRTQTPDRKSVV